jgi:hypothetical protein
MKTIDSLRFFQITMISSFFDSTILKELELAKNFKNFKELPNIGMYYVLVAFGLSFLVIFPKYFFGGQNSSSVQDIHIGNCTLNPTTQLSIMLHGHVFLLVSGKSKFQYLPKTLT